MRNISPYDKVNWGVVTHNTTVTHSHFYPRGEDGFHGGGDETEQGKLDRQKPFDDMYERGIRVFGISNYYPSVPDIYPIEDYVPETHGVVSYPNAEHKGFGEHFNQLGSLLYNADWNEEDERWNMAEDFYKTIYDSFDDIIANFKYEDGGGITINHPKRQKLQIENVERYINRLVTYLQHSDKVLGMEVYNYRSELRYTRGKAFDMWDVVLSKGYQCFGFFAQDMHDEWSSASVDGIVESRNIILADEYTEKNMLVSLRKGEFYGAIHGEMLRFTNIKKDGNTINIKTDTGTEIRFISDNGEVVKSVESNEASYEIQGNETYIRIEADDTNNNLDEGLYWSQSYETVYSQPYMLKPKTDNNEEEKIKDSIEKHLLLMS